jgi:CDP-glycerol glycerophosphotransferase
LAISQDGLNYGCNPKAITDALLKYYSGEVDIYWAFRRKHIPQNMDRRIKTVVIASWKYYFVAATTRVIIHNTHFDFFVPLLRKRKEQIYIQTWHGTALKKIEKDAVECLHPEYFIKALDDSAQSDIILSGSQYHTATIKKAFWFPGKILETGMPRNDIFFTDNQASKDKIFTQYGIEQNTQIILFCPTFRTDAHNFHYHLNTNLLKNSLEEKFGGKWCLFVRLHRWMSEDMSKVFDFNPECMVDVTAYPDIQELLHIASVLITDYSSVMFDFMLTKRPCFIFATDEKFYDRGTYIDIRELPFPVAGNNEQLVENIKNFNENDYLDDLKKFETQTLVSCETGEAAQKTSEFIVNEIRKRECVTFK